jgi:glycosyltransferase involved in cell wall biosynthesis
VHIAYLIPTIDQIGGAERQLIELATGMAHRGSQVTVIALSGRGGSAAQVLSANNVSLLSLDMRRGLADLCGWTALRRWIIAAQPEILHAHLPHAALMARVIRLAAPVRVVVETIHSPAIGGISRQISYRLTSHLPTLVTAVSRAAAAPWLEAGMLHESELAVIPNGVDTTCWRNDHDLQRCSLLASIWPYKFSWLAVGRLDPVKDHETLLRAFALLPDSAQLTIVGTGPLEHSLRRLARDLRIHSRISFAGFQNDIRSFMQEADAFVLSSRWEGLPVALMEASACELPAIFTGNAGCRELLPNSSIDPVAVADPRALASAMQKLMDLTPEERRQIGAEARRRIVAQLDIRSILCRWEKLYCHLLALNPRPAHRRHCSLPLQAPVYSSTTEKQTYSPPTSK